jgi:hypothetical protein
MKAKLMFLLCFFSWHKWIDADCLKLEATNYPLRACTRCKKLQEGTYDMTYGCTNWKDK